MKYSEYLKKNIIQEWKYFYINYDLLKSIINDENSTKFSKIIESELQKVNSFFKIIIKYEKYNENINNYIILNYMALFKLIKKHDKYLCKNKKIEFFERISKEKFYNYFISTKRIQKDTKLVIFDKDGTILNNEKIFAPWTEKIVNKLYSISKFDKKLLYKHLGYNYKTKKFTGNSIVAKGTFDDVRNAISNFVKKNLDLDFSSAKRFVTNNWCEIIYDNDNVVPFGNTRLLFQKLKNNNIKVAICTSDDRKHTINMLKILNAYDIVDKIVCGDDSISSKPSPEPIWEICEELNVLPSETIMIGDTISDIQAGINSRCKQIYGVLSGGYSTNHLNNADCIFKDITEAVEHILI